MKFIQIITIITLCVKIGSALPLMQLIENEDEVLAKDVINISNESKSSESDESNSDESHPNVTTEYSIFDTHLYPISQSAISQVPFLQDELNENFQHANGTQPNKIQSFGILSAFNLPWLSGITFHKQSNAEHKLISELNVTVSGELFESTDEIATTIKAVTQHANESINNTSVTTPPTIATTIISSTIADTKKINNASTTNVTTVVSTTESIKEKLIEKIAEVAAEPIILTQGVR